ncbi:MAG: hypothetical protein NVSMB64_29670 [Candidatus Velthaea sp.]
MFAAQDRADRVASDARLSGYLADALTLAMQDVNFHLKLLVQHREHVFAALQVGQFSTGGVDQFYSGANIGNKRRLMSEDDIAKVTRIYGDFEDGEFSKVLPNDAFGYRTITVERPLRLNFQVTPERLALLGGEKSLTKNGLDLEDLKTALMSIDPAKAFKNRPEFLKSFDAVLKKAGVNLTAPQYKAVWQALSERDKTADVCTGAKGKAEPDADLRDTENVPLVEDVQAFFEREVKPYVAHSWIEDDKTKVGYEVPFTRVFFKYVPPRSIRDIDTDLAAVTADIVALLSEVTS